MHAQVSEPSSRHSATGKPGDALLSVLATTSFVFLFILWVPRAYKLNNARVHCSGSRLQESLVAHNR